MNWTDLNRRLDEKLEPEEAEEIIKKFHLDPRNLPAHPTLREVVETGRLSLGDVSKILQPDPESVEEVYPEEYLEAERKLNEELDDLNRIVPMGSEPVHYFPRPIEVVNKFGVQEHPADSSSDESQIDSESANLISEEPRTRPFPIYWIAFAVLLVVCAIIWLKSTPALLTPTGPPYPFIDPQY